ncbi:UDP-glucose 4-epimerase [Polaromonas vacuolata]|uniref:UDP-glucose 4-epimerase n=1 Tax=Polaromonas vacuolata TaxID=37448 RepID=A0A6H2H7P3_9BURK|nr:UDP-glucose 4-epimerase [Polaromonas vacuolata]
MNILLTDGAGYIGSHTCVALIQAGFTPVIVDDFSNSDPAVLLRLKKSPGKLLFVSRVMLQTQL